MYMHCVSIKIQTVGPDMQWIVYHYSKLYNVKEDLWSHSGLLIAKALWKSKTRMSDSWRCPARVLQCPFRCLSIHVASSFSKKNVRSLKGLLAKIDGTVHHPHITLESFLSPFERLGKAKLDWLLPVLWSIRLLTCARQACVCAHIDRALVGAVCGTYMY